MSEGVWLGLADCDDDRDCDQLDVCEPVDVKVEETEAVCEGLKVPDALVVALPDWLCDWVEVCEAAAICAEDIDCVDVPDGEVL